MSSEVSRWDDGGRGWLRQVQSHHMGRVCESAKLAQCTHTHTQPHKHAHSHTLMHTHLCRNPVVSTVTISASDATSTVVPPSTYIIPSPPGTSASGAAGVSVDRSTSDTYGPRISNMEMRTRVVYAE